MHITLFGLISGDRFLGVLWDVCKWGLIFWVLWWALGKIKLDEPWNKIATVLLVLFSVFVLIDILNGMAPGRTRIIGW